MPLPSLEGLDVGQRDGFSIAHFVRRPILEGLSGRSLHRVLTDRRGLWFLRALPCNQVQADKQANKDHANQRQGDESLLS